MSETLPDGADAVLAQAGLVAPFMATRLAGGMNNQVFQVKSAGRDDVVLKAYFNDADDTRDRLGAEFAFLQFAAQQGVACVPRPLAQDRARHLGVYSFAAGRATQAADVTDDAVAQAIAFLTGLNANRAAVPQLPAASEACLSVDQHLATVERRLVRLRAALGTDDVAQDAAAFLDRDVAPLWSRIQNAVHAQFKALGVDPAQTQAPIVSPSDFGFHNALIADTGAITFLDFEYAGADDPAKLVGDAVHQVKVPIPRHYYTTFRDAVAAWSPAPELERRRTDALLPIYGVKWIVIMLNEFLPIGERRRAFAAHRTDRRAEQLAAARAKFARLAAEIF